MGIVMTPCSKLIPKLAAASHDPKLNRAGLPNGKEEKPTVRIWTINYEKTGLSIGGLRIGGLRLRQPICNEVEQRQGPSTTPSKAKTQEGVLLPLQGRERPGLLYSFKAAFSRSSQASMAEEERKSKSYSYPEPKRHWWQFWR